MYQGIRVLEEFEQWDDFYSKDKKVNVVDFERRFFPKYGSCTKMQRTKN